MLVKLKALRLTISNFFVIHIFNYIVTIFSFLFVFLPDEIYHKEYADIHQRVLYTHSPVNADNCRQSVLVSPGDSYSDGFVL